MASSLTNKIIKGPVLGKILNIRISEAKGASKTTVEHCRVVEDFGIEGDVHGGKGDRQVSLFGMESAQKVEKQGLEGICHGRFAENVTTEGIVLYELSVGAKIWLGDTLHQVTQIGKACHQECTIKTIAGSCVMSKEVIFTRVVQGGPVSVGQSICTALVMIE